ncbi:hypothetical protein HYALB_00013615, partial [Hymenoscyphus albidus]
MARFANEGTPAHPNIRRMDSSSLEVILDFTKNSPFTLRQVEDNGDWRYDITFLDILKPHNTEEIDNVRLIVKFLQSHVEKNSKDVLNDQAQILRHTIKELNKFDHLGAFEGMFEMPGKMLAWNQLRNAAYLYQINPEVAWSFEYKV